MSLSTSINNFYYRNRLTILPLSLTIGVPILIVSALAIMHKAEYTGITKTMNEFLGYWAYWLILVGIALTIFGAYYLGRFFQMSKEFKELMDTPSRVKFIKNLDRIEELAWKLHPKYEKMVMKRKEKFNIK